MLVGREAELAQLRHWLAGGEAVALVGEAGVGKTALVRDAVAGSARRLLEGGGLSTLSWRPYLAIERALGRRPREGDEVYVASDIRRSVGDGILFLDDLHWVDEHTRRLLPLLVGRVSMVTAVRRGDPAAGPAFAEIERLGFRALAVEPLPESDAAELVRLLRPDLGPGASRRIVAQAGGNPLLLEELAAHGGATESLRLAVAARLRHLSPAARHSMRLLALAGRPLPAGLLPAPAGELREGGVVTSVGEAVALRHALLGETLADELEPHERRALHGELARLLPTGGEAARHHEAAGERELARTAALRAAEETPFTGERGRHLALAARCSEGDESDRLRLEGARELIEAHDYVPVGELLKRVTGDDRLIQAEASLLRSRLHVVELDFNAARASWRHGMELADGTGSDVETRLRLEGGRIACLVDVSGNAVDAAEAAVAAAKGAGRHEPVATYVLGSAQLNARNPHWARSLERAISLAGRSGETVVEYAATNNLLMGLLLDGRLPEARAIAIRARRLARERHLGRWDQRLAVWLVAVSRHRGRPDLAVARGEALLDEVTEALDRLLAVKHVAHALIDVGRLAPARTVIEAALEETAPVPGPQRDGRLEIHGEALSILARLELASGRPRAALAAAERARPLYAAGSTSDTRLVAPIVEAWARLELGLPVEVVAGEQRHDAISQGAPVEIDGVALLARGRAAAAAGRFEQAAALWRGRAFDGFVRCRWAHADSLRRAGRRAAAIAALEEVELLARRGGYAGEVARIERSLRLCGVRRAAPRGRRGEILTPRERAILALVADGYSNGAIAQMLGVGRPTVAQLVQSAARKLGAETRAQAAALAAAR